MDMQLFLGLCFFTPSDLVVLSTCLSRRHPCGRYVFSPSAEDAAHLNSLVLVKDRPVAVRGTGWSRAVGFVEDVITDK